MSSPCRLAALVKKLPLAQRIAAGMRAFADPSPFPGSDKYWEARYQCGDNSGSGSYGRLAQFKAQVLNEFVESHSIRSVIEFGCGDGNQLSFAKYPSYIGLDVARTAIDLCNRRFQDDTSKSFYLYHPFAFVDRQNLFRADLAVSLDVIYHLVEDEVYHQYMNHLFHAARRFAIIYSTNHEEHSVAAHVRHRAFSPYVQKQFTNWKLINTIANPYPPSPSASDETESSAAEFLFFEQKNPAP